MEKNKNNSGTAWDCKFYKNETTCAALRTMVCREKRCKFYKRIGEGDGTARKTEKGGAKR